MLVAKWQRQLVYAADVASGRVVISREELRCPSCNKPVILKKGDLKSAHFAHQKHSGCQPFSEGETVEHNTLKKTLFDWSDQQFALESYLPNLHQRPDLLSAHLAIEIQCSFLAQKRMIERTTNYVAHDYQVWWLLGEKLAPKSHKKLTRLQRTFCGYHSQWGCYFWCLDSETREITLCYQVIEYPNGRLTFQKKRWTFKQESLAAIYSVTTSVTTKQVRGQTTSAERKYFWGNYQRIIQQGILRQETQIIKLQKECYRRRKNLQTLTQWMYRPSAYYLFYGVRLLACRLCFEELVKQRRRLSKNEANELYKIWCRQTTMKWLFPLISQQKIQKLLFLECIQLTQVTIVRNFGK
ncbi:hypothetical protein BAU15_12590 [Enterococcus sp. JM4C]|uniref:competence protein CoiA n=1 Tax=Candidatus Enterococcus huntleyi TaxID=1857217 RepID=UPI00137B16BC|nr:competence protein CoiA family protein [Enterococcus sp. JM4C]KAF1296389.1 hypothetical protein BAU15_12590 [Enterococcus sp. JM4C]